MLNSPSQFAENALDVLENFPRYMPLDYLNTSPIAFDNTFLTYQPGHSYANKHQSLIHTYQFNSAKTKTNLARQFKRTADWAIRQDLPLSDLKADGMGCEAFFMSMGDVGLRASPFFVFRVRHPLMLPALLTSYDAWLRPQEKWLDTFKQFNLVRSTIEVLPRVDCSNITLQDVIHLKDTAAQQGLHYHDAHSGNQGWYQKQNWDAPRQVIIDPHAACRKGIPFYGF